MPRRIAKSYDQRKADAMAAWLSVLRQPRTGVQRYAGCLADFFLLARRSRARGAGRRQSAALRMLLAERLGLLYLLHHAVAWSQRVWRP